jgi:hypothetical protein
MVPNHQAGFNPSIKWWFGTIISNITIKKHILSQLFQCFNPQYGATNPSRTANRHGASRP